MQVAYTNHIGHSSRDTHTGKNTAISSIADLAATEKHNNHDYTAADVGRMQSAIDLDYKHLNRHYVMDGDELVRLDGKLNLEARVREIYAREFDDVVEIYNNQQIAKGHSERTIKSYIDKISNDKQQEVAVEGLLQIGSLEDWEDKNDAEREKAADILLKGLKATLAELSGDGHRFVLAGASLHMNEGTPHLHYVGVPIEDTPNAKYGLQRRVKRSAVFTRETLGDGLQDRVRAKIEPLITTEFGWTFEPKRTGRNKDLDKRTYVNDKLQKEIEERESQLSNLDLQIQKKQDQLKADRLAADNLRNHIATLERKRDDAEDDLDWLTIDIANANAVVIDTKKYIADSDQYNEEADLTDRLADNLSDTLDIVKEAPKIFKQSAAAEFISAIKNKFNEIFKIAKVMISRLQRFEENVEMEPARQRSRGLQAKIDNAEQRSVQAFGASTPSKHTPGQDEQLREYYRQADSFWKQYREIKECTTEELRRAYEDNSIRDALRRHRMAQHCVKNSVGLITLGLSVTTWFLTRSDYKKELQRAEQAKEAQSELRELSKEAMRLSITQRDARRRDELTDELERAILEQQSVITKRVHELRKEYLCSER